MNFRLEACAKTTGNPWHQEGIPVSLPAVTLIAAEKPYFEEGAGKPLIYLLGNVSLAKRSIPERIDVLTLMGIDFDGGHQTDVKMTYMASFDLIFDVVDIRLWDSTLRGDLGTANGKTKDSDSVSDDLSVYFAFLSLLNNIDGGVEWEWANAVVRRQPKLFLWPTYYNMSSKMMTRNDELYSLRGHLLMFVQTNNNSTKIIHDQSNKIFHSKIHLSHPTATIGDTTFSSSHILLDGSLTEQFNLNTHIKILIDGETKHLVLTEWIPQVVDLEWMSPVDYQAVVNVTWPDGLNADQYTGAVKLFQDQQEIIGMDASLRGRKENRGVSGGGSVQVRVDGTPTLVTSMRSDNQSLTGKGNIDIRFNNEGAQLLSMNSSGEFDWVSHRHLKVVTTVTQRLSNSPNRYTDWNGQIAAMWGEPQDFDLEVFAKLVVDDASQVDVGTVVNASWPDGMAEGKYTGAVKLFQDQQEKIGIDASLHGQQETQALSGGGTVQVRVDGTPTLLDGSGKMNVRWGDEISLQAFLVDGNNTEVVKTSFTTTGVKGLSHQSMTGSGNIDIRFSNDGIQILFLNSSVDFKWDQQTLFEVFASVKQFQSNNLHLHTDWNGKVSAMWGKLQDFDMEISTNLAVDNVSRVDIGSVINASWPDGMAEGKYTGDRKSVV